MVCNFQIKGQNWQVKNKLALQIKQTDFFLAIFEKKQRKYILDILQNMLAL